MVWRILLQRGKGTEGQRVDSTQRHRVGTEKHRGRFYCREAEEQRDRETERIFNAKRQRCKAAKKGFNTEGKRRSYCREAEEQRDREDF
jgi:hypothetical protein